MRINNNLSALTAFGSLNATNKSLSKAIATLSTGLRINSAADDAAGFAVSEGMRSQISGLGVAMRNSQDGIQYASDGGGGIRRDECYAAEDEGACCAGEQRHVDESGQAVFAGGD